ncbi:MAG: PAS domain S-box protein, partial [Chitinophagaceae bacterium]
MAFGVPIQLPRKEGIQTRYINFVYEAFREGSGLITGVMAVATDVTEQILATRKIEEAEERARLAIEAAELGTFEVNMDTDATLISERMAAIFDVPVDAKREEFIAAIFPEDLPIRNSAYKNAQENGVLDYDGRVQWKDGTIHWMRVRGKVIRNEEGKPNRLVGVVQDITEQKTFAEALAQQVRERTLQLEVKNRELERSNTNLEEFAHVASHDLKEPIRKILFFTDRLKNELAGKITESEERLFGRIELAGVRMRTLVDDLLQYSHVSQRPPEKELVDLAGKVKKVLEDLELEIEQKQAKITVGPLPQVLGYRRQLQQLFQNLITNALKYHKPGEAPQVTISSRVLKGSETPLLLNELEKEASFCMIEVADAGIGFEQAQAEKAFQMFQRLH